MDVERKMNRGEMAVKIEKQQGKIAELQAENKRLAKENNFLMGSIEVMNDKCVKIRRGLEKENKRLAAEIERLKEAKEKADAVKVY